MIINDKEKMLDFANLTARYSGVINKVCYSYAGDTVDFHDLKQEALVNIWRGMDKLNAELNLSSWIYRVTINSCVSSLRKNKRNGQPEQIENHPEIIDVEVDKVSMLREMYTLINCLDSIDKAIIMMWIDGNDYQTIAEAMGMNKATVGTRIHRIKEKLVELSNK